MWKHKQVYNNPYVTLVGSALTLRLRADTRLETDYKPFI